MWADGEDFIVIEHDVEFGADAIETLESCPEPFCTADEWFHCTRFRAELIEARPDAFSGLPMSERHWIPLEWQARERIERVARLHHHRGLGVSNQTRGLNGTVHAGLYTSAQRWPVWAEWLRTLGPEHADEFTAKAWHAWEQTACRRDGCRRAPAGVRHRVFAGREICLDGRWCPHLTTKP